MKALALFTSSGPVAVLTTVASPTDPSLLAKLQGKGIDRFIAYEIPVDVARERYGNHFQVVVNDLHETDDLRVLDINGERVFKLFRFAELGQPIVHDP